jgi:hypothetical protein
VSGMKQAEVSVPLAELIRKVGISEHAFCRLNANPAGCYDGEAAICCTHALQGCIDPSNPRTCEFLFPKALSQLANSVHWEILAGGQYEISSYKLGICRATSACMIWCLARKP